MEHLIEAKVAYKNNTEPNDVIKFETSSILKGYPDIQFKSRENEIEGVPL